MAYFKINGTDFSKYVNALKVDTKNVYNIQTNAAGNGVVDVINKKRVIEVGIIPLEAQAMKDLQAVISLFNVSISFRNPKTNELEESVNCILPEDSVEYYTIRHNKTSFKGFTLKFEEL